MSIPANDDILFSTPDPYYQPLDFETACESRKSLMIDQQKISEFSIAMDGQIDSNQNVLSENNHSSNDENRISQISSSDQQTSSHYGQDKNSHNVTQHRSKTKAPGERQSLILCDDTDGASVKDGQQLSKNDLRRQNLRRRRSREQLVQVVDAFIREATIFTVYQSYVEANFINDMMNIRNEIVDQSVKWGLRYVIQEVISEIYIANEAGLIIQTVILRESKNLTNDCLSQITQEDFKQNFEDSQNSLQFGNELDQYLHQNDDDDDENNFNQESEENESDYQIQQSPQKEESPIKVSIMDAQSVNQSLDMSLAVQEDLNWHFDIYEQTFLEQSELLINEIAIEAEQQFAEEQKQLLLEQERIQAQHIEEQRLLKNEELRLLQIEESIQNTSDSVVDKLMNLIATEIIGENLLHKIEYDHNELEAADKLVEELLNHHFLNQILGLNFDQTLVQDELVTDVIEVQIKNDTKEIATETIQSEIKIRNDVQLLESEIQTEIKSKVFENCQRNLLRECYKEAREFYIENEQKFMQELCDQVLEETIYTDLVDMVIIEVENEGLLQDQVQTLIDEQTKQVTQKEYEESIALDLLMSKMMGEIMNEIVQDQVQTQSYLQKELPLQINNQILEETNVMCCIDVAEDSIMVFQQVVSYVKVETLMVNSLLSNTLDDVIIMDGIYDKLISQLIIKELAFQLQLERDSQMLANSLFDNCLNDFTEGNILHNVVPAQIQYNMIDTRIQSESVQVCNQTVATLEASDDIMTEFTYQMILEILVEGQNQDKKLINKEKSTNKDLESKAISLYHQQFLNRFLKKWLRHLADDLILKLITESIYKRIMSKIIKRNVINIIQYSVDTISNLEEDTISIANTVLSGFIRNEINLIICQEIMLTQDSLIMTENFIKEFITNEVQNISIKQLQLANLLDGSKHNASTSSLHRHRKQFVYIDDSQYQSNQSNQMRGNDYLIKVDNQSSDMELRSSATSSVSDADVFSEQDEGSSHQNTNTPNSYQIMSPSKKPDFNRNILSSSKSITGSVTSSMNKFPKHSDTLDSNKNYPNFFEQTNPQSNLNTFMVSNPRKTHKNLTSMNHYHGSTAKHQSNNQHNRSGSSDIEVKAIRFTKNPSTRGGQSSNVNFLSHNRVSKINYQNDQNQANDRDTSPAIRYAPQGTINDRYKNTKSSKQKQLKSQLSQQQQMKQVEKKNESQPGILISQDVGGSSIDPYTSSQESFMSAVNSFSKIKGGLSANKKSKNNSNLLVQRAFNKSDKQFFNHNISSNTNAYHNASQQVNTNTRYQNSGSNQKKKSKLSVGGGVIGNNSSNRSSAKQNRMLYRRSSEGMTPQLNDIDDKMCTVYSDDDEDLVQKGDRSIETIKSRADRSDSRSSTLFSVEKNKRKAFRNKQSAQKIVADVLASQPKEGIKFIESKVQSSLQSQQSQKNLEDVYYKKNVPVKTISVEVSKNSSYHNQSDSSQFDSTVQESYREKFSVNHSIIGPAAILDSHKKDSAREDTEFYSKLNGVKSSEKSQNTTATESHKIKSKYQYLKSKTSGKESANEFASPSNNSSALNIQNSKKNDPMRKAYSRQQTFSEYIPSQQNSQTQALSNVQSKNDSQSLGKSVERVPQQESLINASLEKLLISFKAKYQEIKKQNCRSAQLASIDLLIKMCQKIIDCNRDIDHLFEIDQQLKDSLIKLSSQQRHQQESFSVILLTNQLALLNYQKLSCLVEKKSAHRNTLSNIQPFSNQTPKSTPTVSSVQSKLIKATASLKTQQNTTSLSKIINGSHNHSSQQNTDQNVYHNQVSGMQHVSSQVMLVQQKKSREDLATMKHTFSCNSNTSLNGTAQATVSAQSKKVSKQQQQQMMIKHTSNYFSNNSDGGNTISHQAKHNYQQQVLQQLHSQQQVQQQQQIQTQMSLPNIDIKLFQPKDQVYIMKCIGKSYNESSTNSSTNTSLMKQETFGGNTNGLAGSIQVTGNNNNGNTLSCHEFQKQQFFLMTLHHVMRNNKKRESTSSDGRTKYLKKEDQQQALQQYISIEELFNNAKVRF
ncbi:UNKNOWN [Stylonychia lemnae]|uniref:Uncharacterized protein n=1 Tax=Stylonychia lemnae TaxID=5949 RepID=A0A077ZQF6_STYLE|nr:UNKNOWN [Stylonychia lemnae]|eukprot:CDW72143.1 UNKNOWN [Stylonychia lemnae]